ncbi:hypothetical protein Clacol_003071 [Clathrus columnatus]|uniref:Flavin-containing monooxygenase n=1 Tax=Clathrus columnatus TaxID=1419009 RepID=A0AAV5A2G2_9AGAM|nr:hypothetical protein Clacol_003071 [Clathrus columnatus]
MVAKHLSDVNLNLINPGCDEDVKYSDLVCIGTGLSAIGLGSRLRQKFKFESMHFYDRNETYSGTWWSNHYPECQEARWDEDRCIWRLRLQDNTTGRVFFHDCRILISAIGTFLDPKIPSIPGANTFRGEQFHTARWKDDVFLQGKNVVVIGNGCTASQLIPALQPRVGTLTQIIRTPQWLLPIFNPQLGPKIHWLFQNFPLFLEIARLYFLAVPEAGWPMLFLYFPGDWMRSRVEKTSKKFIYTNAPKEYHEILIPTYPIGCKRRIYDPDSSYLNALKADNFKLTKSDIVRITEDGIQTTNSFYPADVIVYATGFETNGGLGKLHVYGKDGIWLDDYWNQMGGRSAYNTIAVHGCEWMPAIFTYIITYLSLILVPNFFMLFGPNTNTGHTSVLMMIENAIMAVIKLIQPVLKGDATFIEVKKNAYENYTRDVQAASKGLVTSASLCNNCKKLIDTVQSIVDELIEIDR